MGQAPLRSLQYPMRTSNFTTWLSQMFLGFGLVAGSLQVGLIFWSSGGLELAAACAVVGLVGIVILARAESREHPRRVLRKARKKLQLPTQWQVRFDKSLKKGGRVIPIAVIRSDNVRFVIDVQPHKQAIWNAASRRIQPGPVFGKKMPRKAPRRDPMAPLLQAAQAWGATAVVWLPDAAEGPDLRNEDWSLIVVTGDASELKQALQDVGIKARPMAVSKKAQKESVSEPSDLEAQAA
jgi:hypothetical protein